MLGQIPAVALADEIEAGNIRALFLTGGNPLTAFPQPERLQAALRTLDVLAVVDVADNALTEIATHVLPATGQLERADITLAELTALRSGLQATRPVVEPVADRRPVWWMFAALSRAMGHGTHWAASIPTTCSDEDFLRGVLAHSTLDAERRVRGRAARHRNRPSSTAGSTPTCSTTGGGRSRPRRSSNGSPPTKIPRPPPTCSRPDERWRGATPSRTARTQPDRSCA